MSRTVVRSLVAALVAVLGFLAALLVSDDSAESARGPRVQALRLNVTKADDVIAVSVTVVTVNPQIPCSGMVRLRSKRHRLPTIVTSKTGGAQWSWRVPRSVRGGRWRISVTCRGGGPPTLKRKSIPVDRGLGSGTWTSAFKHMKRHRFDVSKVDRPGGSGGAGDLYPIGQCTWWVATLRPDLPFFSGTAGDARNWARSAEKLGFPVDAKPSPGDVAVFQPGQYGAGKFGHVAYVKAVNGNKIVISEANYGARHPGSTRTIDSAGLAFIHQLRGAGPPQTVTTLPPPPTTPTTTQPTVTAPPPPPDDNLVRVVHYDCPFRSPTLAHTVEPSKHWGNAFTTQGTAITNGTLYVAAQDDKTDGTPHRATVGFYTDASKTTELGSMPITIPIGGTGITFTLPRPIAVGYNERLYVAVTAIDRFTAYDIDQSAAVPASPDGCFIGRVEGTSPPVFAETVTYETSAPTFADYHSASNPGPRLSAGQTVSVFCKVYDATIPSVYPDGYWYRIASGPWSGRYYAAANVFLNGDPPGGPYQYNVDPKVPDCR